MQYKRLLFTSLVAFSAGSLYAQRISSTRVTKIDTIVVRAGDPTKKAMANCVPTGNPPALTKVEQPKVKKSVPLANEKAYYGEMSDYVAEFVRKYLQVHNRTLDVVQGKSLPHFSLIDNVLTQHDIPKELKYLAVIESALNHNAKSKVGAVGPWQFMAPTARLMGLTVSGKRDDRKDWFKSTNAAAKYLTYLYDNLNDWLLVVAAYNSGPTPVLRAISRTGSHNFWDIKKYLPKETQGHVLAFIATATIFENLSKFIGINNIPSDLSMSKAAEIAAVKGAEKKVVKPAYTEEELKNMAIVKLTEPLSMDLMVQELGMDKRILNKWNPDYELYEMDTYPTDYYSLRLPKDKLDKFVEKKEFLTKRSKQILSAQNM